MVEYRYHDKSNQSQLLNKLGPSALNISSDQSFIDQKSMFKGVLTTTPKSIIGRDTDIISKRIADISNFRKSQKPLSA